MQIKAIITIYDADGVHGPGSINDVPEQDAAALIGRGFAAQVQESLSLEPEHAEAPVKPAKVAKR